MLQWVCSNGALCFVYATSLLLKLINKSLLRSCFPWAPGAPQLGEGGGRCSCASCPVPGAAGNAVFHVVWACYLQGQLFLFKFLSLTLRQAPGFNKFLMYLKVVDTPCVRELHASTAACGGLWGFCCSSAGAL